METATRLVAVLLTSAAVLACSGDDKAPAPPPIDYDALLNQPRTGADAGPARPPINVEDWPSIDPGAASPKAVMRAVATLQSIDTTANNRAAGTVRFSATADGAKVNVDLTGLAFMTKYMLKVHVAGDCSSNGENAGRGYNFAGSSFDQPTPAMGYISDIEADFSGGGKGEQIVRGVAIQGGYSIVGRSVVLHAKGSDPASDGPVLACGVIGIVGDGGK